MSQNHHDLTDDLDNLLKDLNEQENQQVDKRLQARGIP